MREPAERSEKEEKEEKKSGKKRSVGRTVGNVILAVVLAAAIALAAVLFIGKAMNKPVFIFGRSIAWVLTASMEPEIPAQSFILLEEASADDVSVGEVITFRSENPSLKGGYNTHRVVSISEDRSVFTTKGDNNNTDDGEYSAKAGNIVGKYVRKVPVLTALMRFFTKPYGFALMIVLLLGLTVALFLPDVLKARKAVNAEKESIISEEEKLKLIEAEVARLRQENAQNGAAPPEENEENKERPDGESENKE